MHLANQLWLTLIHNNHNWKSWPDFLLAEPLTWSLGSLPELWRSHNQCYIPQKHTTQFIPQSGLAGRNCVIPTYHLFCAHCSTPINTQNTLQGTTIYLPLTIHNIPFPVNEDIGMLSTFRRTLTTIYRNLILNINIWYMTRVRRQHLV